MANFREEEHSYFPTEQPVKVRLLVLSLVTFCLILLLPALTAALSDIARCQVPTSASFLAYSNGNLALIGIRRNSLPSLLCHHSTIATLLGSDDFTANIDY